MLGRTAIVLLRGGGQGRLGTLVSAWRFGFRVMPCSASTSFLEFVPFMGFFEKIFGIRSLPISPAGGDGRDPEEIGAAELQRRLALSPPPVLLDVREARELRAHGSIVGRVHIPMGHVATRLGELDPGRPIVVYCAHGVRSYKVAAFLLGSGFQEVASLRGGFAGWRGEVQRGG